MNLKYRFDITRIDSEGKEVSDTITLPASQTTKGCLGPILAGVLDGLDEKATGKKINYGPIIDH